MKYEIKNRWSGKVQFTAEIKCKKGDSESVKIGLAVKWGIENDADLSSANLRYADLRSANLRYANLRYADLSSANLRSADLSSADLRSANLRSADLRSADLRSANLRSADLRYADLRYADLSSANLRSGVKAYGYTFNKAPIQLHDSYGIEIWQGFMKIGCEEHLLSEWAKFTQKRIIEMDGKDSAKWWKKWKPALFALAEAGDRMELPDQSEKEQKAA